MIFDSGAHSSPLIWPLRDKLFNVALMQTRPKSNANRPVPVAPKLPWQFMNRPPGAMMFNRFNMEPRLIDQLVRNQPKQPKQPTALTRPLVVRPLKLPARIAMISGVTRNSSGAVLGGCRVELYETATDLPLQTVTSDATTGAFIFTAARYSPRTHYIVAYKAGSSDVAGTTVNTLTGA